MCVNVCVKRRGGESHKQKGCVELREVKEECSFWWQEARKKEAKRKRGRADVCARERWEER